MGMHTNTTRLAAGGRLVRDAVLETLWPTRCCACDVPGAVLCAECERDLAWLDLWQACPACGAPFGRIVCTECTGIVLEALGRSSLPFDSCRSAVLLDATAHRMVTAWKDGGEARLGAVMARILADVLPRSWFRDGAHRADSARMPPDDTAPQAVLPVPATRAAVARRGFDHAEELARELGTLLGLPCWTPLARPRAKDQRGLSRRERARNAKGSFALARDPRPASAQCALPQSVLLVDDVFTTGSTLSDATDTLKAAGVRTVHCATFARAF